MSAQLRLHDPKVLVTGFDRPNLYFQVERTRRKDDFVTQYTALNHPGESGIIYCATRKNVDKLQEASDRIRLCGHKVPRGHVRTKERRQELRQHRTIPA